MTFDEAVAHATKLLAGRDKSSAQLAAALERKGATDDVVRRALERCRALGYLDDARLAGAVARDALDEGWVGEALFERLKAKGFDEAIVSQALAALEGQGPTLRERARALVARRKLEGLKAARFLSSRGFPEEEIAAVVPEVADD